MGSEPFKRASASEAANCNLARESRGFSFYDFFAYNLKEGETAGCVAITDKDYIATYSAGQGMAVHRSIYARVMKDLLGGGEICFASEEVSLSSMLKNRHITARLDCSDFIDPYTRERFKNGTMAFMLPSVITPGHMAKFEEFYERYNADVARACEKFGIEVSFYYPGTREKNLSKNLDNLRDCVRSHVSENNITFDDEIGALGDGSNRSVRGLDDDSCM